MDCSSSEPACVNEVVPAVGKDERRRQEQKRTNFDFSYWHVGVAEFIIPVLYFLSKATFWKSKEGWEEERKFLFIVYFMELFYSYFQT
jgi:hypothetical protein